MSLIGKFMKSLIPTVHAQDEDEEIVDPLKTLRETCTQHHCAKLKEMLEECEERVNSKSFTRETCFQELGDLLHCVDHCSAPKIMRKLK
ncbi:hypothetical protein SNEBB_005164 [Seison nebaliae]|nr:hypothetical protein SNEBB_005164 [Seison nebaliae]